jgi:hypothetical protein
MSSMDYLFTCIVVLPNGHVCDWPENKLIHRPVEPNCPIPENHHEFKMRFGSEVKHD